VIKNGATKAMFAHVTPRLKVSFDAFEAQIPLQPLSSPSFPFLAFPCLSLPFLSFLFLQLFIPSHF
jgi:hypothetical protein